MLLSVNPHEDFSEVDGIAVTSVLELQAAGINRSEFYTPETDCFTADGDASFGQKILDITEAQVKSVVETDGIGNDIRWGTPSRNRCRLLSIHSRILSISATYLASTQVLHCKEVHNFLGNGWNRRENIVRQVH